ncbi:MAG: hypothetical protein DRR08_12655 [Candidatus Parabeggiatoa sp. nov. 2]|nr:MAG: hypothetical protein B6247_15195 [Beggiatoa sp. 4572_84]RKZ59932.1 MAG: hypothetical protein DRR08_12655 [Gammaproteobacteria bacterium]
MHNGLVQLLLGVNGLMSTTTQAGINEFKTLMLGKFRQLYSELQLIDIESFYYLVFLLISFV